MRLFVYEGTPEEIRQVIPTLPQPAVQVTTGSAVRTAPEPSLAPALPSTDANASVFVSLEVARRVLNRRKLSDEQRKVLIAIYKADPAQVLATELQKVVGYTRPQFAGLMGAFGRRVSHTTGYADDAWFFKQEWDNTGDCYKYGLPETVREAMRLEKMV